MCVVGKVVMKMTMKVVVVVVVYFQDIFYSDEYTCSYMSVYCVYIVGIMCIVCCSLTRCVGYLPSASSKSTEEG